MIKNPLEIFGRASLPLAILAVSMAAPLVKLAEGAHPITLATWRLLLAGSLLGLVVRPPGLARARPWAWGGVAGLLLGLHFGAWFWSLELTTVASSVTLVTTAPLFAAIIAPRWLGDRTAGRLWAGAGVALAGVALIAGADGRFGGLGAEALLGDALALLGALAGSVYLLIGRKVREQVDVEAQVVITCLTGALGLLFAGLLAGAPLFPETGRVLGVAVALALVPHLLGHGLLNVSVRRRPAQEVQLALLGEPVISSVIAALFLSEIPHPSFYPGGALVIGGLALGLSQRRPPRGALPPS